MNEGHFTSYAYAKEQGKRAHSSLDPTLLARSAEKWLLYNDARVTVAKEEEVTDGQAYLLFYERRVPKAGSAAAKAAAAAAAASAAAAGAGAANATVRPGRVTLSIVEDAADEDANSAASAAAAASHGRLRGGAGSKSSSSSSSSSSRDGSRNQSQSPRRVCAGWLTQSRRRLLATGRL